MTWKLPDKLIIDHDNNVYFIGVYNSPILDFYGQFVENLNIPNYNVFIAKIDGGGVPVWVENVNTQMTSIKNIGGSNTKTNIDGNNDFYLISEFMGSTVLLNDFMQTNAEDNTRDIFIVKYKGINGETLSDSKLEYS